MRYYLRDGTLLVRGSFRAVSTGPGGGFGTARTLLNHTVPPDWDEPDPLRELATSIAQEGLPDDFFGLLTAVPMKYLCVLQYDFITAFISAGIGRRTINIIITSTEGMTDAALAGAIITATEAKAEALRELSRPVPGTPTDAVIVASEGEPVHPYAGPLTEAGKRIRAAVLAGVPEALHRFEGAVTRDAPSYFIFSRYGGDHWVEWIARDCPYYPCHFAGQRCDFCYCPFYPCGDLTLGQWVGSSSRNGSVWNCAGCTLLHEPEIADYLARNPDAPLRELKERRKRGTS
jgi:adenosylcobinamide hydrolase